MYKQNWNGLSNPCPNLNVVIIVSVKYFVFNYKYVESTTVEWDLKNYEIVTISEIKTTNP